MNSFSFLIFFLFSFVFSSSDAPAGKPWRNRAQVVPGRIECEWYDTGGEGIAYHDMDNVNNGSGKLNPANGDSLNEFRMKEGVDISYTKSKDIDNNAYNKVDPDMNQLYVGWTQPGEWINYTVKIESSGTYQLNTMYTANRDGMIGIDIDGKAVANHVKIPSTYDKRDTVAWRQWHHWNKLESMAEVKVEKGIHVLTLHIEAEGNMNFDYIEWKKK